MSVEGLLPIEAASSGLASLERMLWQAVSTDVHAGGGQVVAFTAPESGAGTTSLTASAAAGLARHLRLRIAVVEAHMSRPFLASACGVDQRPGLSEVLLGAVPLESALRSPEALPNLTVLPAGAPRQAAPGEFAGEAFAQVMQTLRASHDAVLVDAPPTLEEPGTLALLRSAQAAVLVTRARASRKAGVEEATRLIEGAGTRLLGAVLNRWRPELARGIG